MVDEQIAEIDKLNAVINAAERDMLKLRKVMLPALSTAVLHATVVRTAAAQHTVPSQLPPANQWELCSPEPPASQVVTYQNRVAPACSAAACKAESASCVFQPPPMQQSDLWPPLQEYEGAIEARNYTGICMIDRNDELCILYEKANIQEEVMKKGEAMYSPSLWQDVLWVLHGAQPATQAALSGLQMAFF